jgi:RNA polymerase sigma-70 factor (ECF subfamily)
MEADDRHVLLAMHAGDQAAAVALWERCSPRLLAYLRSILAGDAQAALDAAQNVMLRVISLRRSQLAQVEDVMAWLVRLARNEAISVIRANRRRRGRESLSARLRPRSLHGVGKESDDLVADAIARLPRRLREPVVLRHAAGLSFDQIALALGMPRSTAATRYQSAMELLRRELSRPEGSTSRQAALERKEAGIEAGH